MAMKTLDIIAAVLMVFVLLVNSFNIMQMQEMKSGGAMAMQEGSLAGMAAHEAGLSAPETDMMDTMPKGIPPVYGKELGVSYDDVSALDQKKADDAINQLGTLDRQIKLSGADKERYVSIASRISCEYCCGVDSIISKDGSAACGCSHSYAMRGIAKYLVKNHPAEFTDEQILEELSKWKILFFPNQMASKAKVLKSKGIELTYINLASNKYRGIENE